MNVIVGEDGRVTVLDFTMAKTGTPHHDLAHLYFHLALTASRRRRRAPVYAAVQQAMLRGYDPGLTPDAPLFRLMLWQHAICHVAMLAERSVGPLDPVYRWFVRRRWGVCARLPVLAFQE
jgi:hypothetical protein